MRALRLSGLALVAVATLTLSACGSDDTKPDASSKPTASSSSEPESFDIEVTWDEPSDAPATGTVATIAASLELSPEAWTRQILEKGEVEGIAKRFSEEFVIPEQLKINVVSGEEGPNYNPSTQTITLSYGFAELTGNIIAEAQSDLTPEQFGTSWAAVNDFILIHELAHAFVDVMDISVLGGKEEDVADGMATYFFTDEVAGGDQYAFEAAKFFAALQDLQGVPDATQYANEHSLSIVRATDIACKVAGKSRQNLEYIGSLGVMSAARLQRCPDEYEQLSSSWEETLKDHRPAD